jgi:hypothetical protein
MGAMSTSTSMRLASIPQTAALIVLYSTEEHSFPLLSYQKVTTLDVTAPTERLEGSVEIRRVKNS